MKRATQCGLVLLALANAAINARADAVGDYKVILERNPFGLKPPPAPAPAPTNAPPETPTVFKLTGISALFSPPRAMFVNMGNPNKPEYFDVIEGGRGDHLNVLSNGIDFAAGTVRVKIRGEERTMSFDKDGMKPAPGSPLMTAPGGVVQPFRFNPGQAAPGGTLPNTVQPSAAPVSYNAAVPTGLPATAAIPAPVTPITTARVPRVSSQSSPPAAQIVDRAEQVVRIELNRELTKEQVKRGDMPPLPTTELSPPSLQIPPLPARP